jgi:hypothetical protein
MIDALEIRSVDWTARFLLLYVSAAKTFGRSTVTSKTTMER